ncbi:MAG: NFACT family protein, partial [Nitrososphaerota archaeon]|nr:NFACT family protein [Nitrososphaerota archaeon]
NFVSQNRERIERWEVQSVEQMGNERIAKFAFASRKGEERNLYAEFFAHGNLILSDPSKADEIIDVARPQTFRHRQLVRGEKYVLPPTRGVPLQDLTYDLLVEMHRKDSEIAKEQLVAVKWFGRHVGTTRKFVEEIFHRANVEQDSSAKKLTVEKLYSLANAVQSLRKSLEESEAGYVLMPSEESDLDVDVCSIIPNSWSVCVEQKIATIQKFASLDQALDQVQMESIVLNKRKRASAQTRARVAELESAIGKQTTLIGKNESTARELRAIATELMRGSSLGIEQKTSDILLSLGVIVQDVLSGGRLRFVEEPRGFVVDFNSVSLASRLFDEAKRLELSNKKLLEIKLDLESQREALAEQTRSQEDRAEKKIIVERREKQWYERYRWFFTSEGELAIGGRDTTSNSIVINKYMTKDDSVFHADLHGSPFFILKRKSANQIGDALALEMAQATVSFSRAWKDELGSADAYWVHPDQIKKSAPTGEYLPRGSFFIEGRKNFVRHVKVELAVGIALTTNLPEMGAEEESGDTSRVVDQFVVVCGPDRSISEYCSSRVKIAPGKTRSSEFAKRLKQQLIGKLKSVEEKEMAKRLSIDDVIRVLPSGYYKIVSEK